MKITIEGSPHEVAELLNALPNGTETKAKKPYFPPPLTELAEDETITGLAEANRNVGKENAPQAETAEQETKMIVDMLSTMNALMSIKNTK